MAKSMDEVIETVLDYGNHKHNKWFDDPKGNQNAIITPAISSLSLSDFGLFFVDFTHYIRIEMDMPDVIMTKNGLTKCNRWADLVGYVFNLQEDD